MWKSFQFIISSMPSISPTASDETIRVIKAARLANAEALARLAAAFEIGLEKQVDWFWKEPLEKPSDPFHFLDTEELAGYCAGNNPPFWSKILSDTISLIEKHFPHISLVWASFAVDEISPQSPGVKPTRNLGLKPSIVYYTHTNEPTNGFKYSITKPYLDERLRKLKRSASSSGTQVVEQRGIGLCVTKSKTSNDFG